MKFTVDHDYHIHSMLSSCSRDPEQSTERILQYAKDNGLKKICITDHFWDERVEGASNWYAPQNFEHISKAKPLPEEEGIEFCFGAETDMDKFFTVGVDKARYDEFDFVIIPTTHLHMTDFTLSKEDAQSNKRRAELWVERLDALLSMDLPFHKIGIAHLACSLIRPNDRNELLDTLYMIPSSEMERLFSRAARLGVGIELNHSDMKFSDAEADRVLRMFRIAKECGCKFYLGSDAHHPKTLEEASRVFERAIDLLGLEESDKFSF
jgi:HisJ family histidinol phosphate phosphatase